MPSRTKKFKDNQYVLTEDHVWVRDPTVGSYPVDINNFSTEEDYKLFINNEIKSKSNISMMLDDLKANYKKCIIVSDGYEFEQRRELLKQVVRPDVIILGINGSLKKWDYKIVKMDYYVVNNPYKECCLFLPKVKYFPQCITASRTNVDFIKKYKGTFYKYTPTYESKFSGMDKTGNVKIDDYRNSLCAAINIAYFLGIDNILLFCCDNSFKDNKPNSEQLDNGLYCYKQHKFVHNIVDTIAEFLKINDNYFNIGNFSSGWKYKNIPDIPSENLANFFD